MSILAKVLSLIFYYLLAAGGHTVNIAEYFFVIQLPPLLLHNPLQLLVGVDFIIPFVNIFIQHFPHVLDGV